MPRRAQTRKRARRSTRRRRGGYTANMNYDDEKQFMRTIIQKLNNADTEEEEIAVLDTYARFLLHAQHIIEHDRLREVSVGKMVDLLEMDNVPDYVRRTAESALARLQSMD